MWTWRLTLGVVFLVLVTSGLLLLAGYLIGGHSAYQAAQEREAAVAAAQPAPAPEGEGATGPAAAGDVDLSEAESRADARAQAIERQRDKVRFARGIAKKAGLEGVASGLTGVSKGLGTAKSANLKAKDAAARANTVQQGGGEARLLQDVTGGEEQPSDVRVVEPVALAPPSATARTRSSAPPPDMPGRRPGETEEQAQARLRPVMPPPEPEPPQVVFSLQVGYFASQSGARLLSNDLAAKDYDARIVAHADEAGRTWYSVAIGEYGQRDDAERAARHFRNREGKPVRIVFLSAPPPK